MASSSKALTEHDLRNILESEEFWEDLKDSTENVSINSNISVDEPDREAVLDELEILAKGSGVDEEDNEIPSDHNSETEQENSESEDEELPIRSRWYGKDNTKWSKIPALRGRTTAHNLVTILPGLASPARNDRPSEPIHAWNLLITDEMKQKIVDFINLKIISTRKKYKKSKRFLGSRNEFWPSFTDIFKSAHEDIRSMWATDGTYLPCHYEILIFIELFQI
ncbi:hypothetical protein RI129_008539 [Pyrocoelia pectoralis]|uniref:PiggyBac transposable element-derived protein domain-containing protein n=1 Tax=Pyrocoelia pectoralis TaxID=417401 RepID=A0AAN7V7I2_9COLE